MGLSVMGLRVLVLVGIAVFSDLLLLLGAPGTLVELDLSDLLVLLVVCLGIVEQLGLVGFELDLLDLLVLCFGIVGQLVDIGDVVVGLVVVGSGVVILIPSVLSPVGADDDDDREGANEIKVGCILGAAKLNVNDEIIAFDVILWTTHQQ